MKKIFSFIFISLFGLNLLFAQELRNYKYIIVPDKFSDFDENQYKLNYYLKSLLKKKNYEIITAQRDNWPPEVQINNCLAVSADAFKEKSFFNNRIEISFKDCNGATIATYKGVSSIKEFDKGYQDAMKIATQSIGMQDASVSNSATVAQIETPTTTQNETSNQSLYSDGEFTYSKSDLKDGSFLLIRQDNSQVYAQFFPSSRNDVYHVKFLLKQGGSMMTIGYWDGKKLQIEMPDKTNEWNLIELKSSY